MRREELKTICNFHKATMLYSDSAKTRGVSLNTDGTTKQQKKLGVANDMVLSVNELPDGTAISAVEDISKEFAKLRKAAQILGLPNPNSINWTLVVSSSSESASTQKCINRLIEERTCRCGQLTHSAYFRHLYDRSRRICQAKPPSQFTDSESDSDESNCTVDANSTFDFGSDDQGGEPNATTDEHYERLARNK